MSSASVQQMMMQRQFELQQRQLHHIYQGQQELHRAGISSSHHQVQSPGHVLQQGIPQGSFEAGDFRHPSYGSTASSPILIPVGVTRSHGTSIMNPRADQRQSETAETTTSQDYLATSQYMSVSPDDSSQISHGGMNPDAASFAPTYLGATQGEIDFIYAARDNRDLSNPWVFSESLHDSPSHVLSI